MANLQFFNLKSDGSGGGVTDVTATPPITSTGGDTPIISTSMNTNRLIGRSSAGVGVMEEIQVGDGLTLSGGVLTNTASPTPTGYYLSISDSTTQENPTANTPRAVKFNTIDLANGFSLQNQNAVFTGTINNGGAGSGTTLNVTNVASGTIKVGMVLTGGSITSGTFISAFLSGTGGVGTYIVSISQNRTSATYTGTMTSQIVVANTGIYNLQFSSQFDKSDSGVDYVDLWLRKNGSDVTSSAGAVSLQGNSPAYMMASWNYVIELIGGDIIELYWASADINLQIFSNTNQISPYPRPAIQSTILTITQQSGIMAGTGITALNGLTPDVQTFATGTTGTDFNIVSSGSTHTFNIPSASNLARGLVSILAQTFAGIKTFLSAPIFDSLTASRILATDGSKAVQSLDTTTYPDLTELSYVKGVTSALQTQINNKQATITGGATTIVSSNLTASRALASDASGKVAVSATTSTELGYVSGVTSAIQTQLNGKQATLPYTPVYLYAKNSSTFSSSGTGSQILTSLLIPANTFTTGDVIRITARFKKAGTAGTTQTNMLLNTSVSTSGATVFKANVFNNTTLASGMQSEGVIINNTTNTQLAWTATNLGTTDLVNSTAAWQEAVATNWTINQYLIFSCNPNGAGDVVSLIFYQIEKL